MNKRLIRVSFTPFKEVVIDLSRDRVSSIELSPLISYRYFALPTGN